MERVMKKLTLALLASAALALPAAIPAMAQNNHQARQPQAQQQQQKPQNTAATKGQQPNQQASNRTVSPRQLGRNGVRKVQQALDNDGFHAGRADGIWGRNTRTALMHFQKSKDIKSNGQLNNKTLSDLGVKVASNQTFGSQNGNGMNSSQTMGNQGMGNQGMAHQNMNSATHKQ
jgi:hypothetical protein